VTTLNTDWRHRARCIDYDPELFFPIGNTGAALLQAEEAKAVCRRCPVMERCREWALETGQDAGVWGGLGEDERLACKRRSTYSHQPQPCGTRAAYKRHLRKSEDPCERCSDANTAYIRTTPLSSRELEVLTALADGSTREQIADHLGITRKTIDGYLGRLRSVLAADTDQLVAAAREAGILPAVEGAVAA
jgi:WhiB family redox-sensing transcriptional regulator